jgi:hypothetical protein
MRSVEETVTVLRRKLSEHWHTWLTAEAPNAPTVLGPDVHAASPGGAALAATFPLTLPLGHVSGTDLAADFSRINRDARGWIEFASTHCVVVLWTHRKVLGSAQQIATHVTITDLDLAGAIAGAPWPEKLTTARARLARLTSLFGPVPASLLRSVTGLAEVDFQMLCTTAIWLRENDPTGMTARQVPVEGVHGKWLNAHRRELRVLSGRESLGLVERPSQVRYTYLDPAHRRAGGRVHDSHTVGDISRPLYQPTVALISENKDTALLFSEIPGGISIFGNGDAAVRQLPTVPWLRDIGLLVYWGDIDADGYEIVNALRASGLAVHTMLMNSSAYERYERYGSQTDAAGRSLEPATSKPLVHLTDEERAVYDRLVDPTWARVRRIEQERIPLAHAAAALAEIARR